MTRAIDRIRKDIVDGGKVPYRHHVETLLERIDALEARMKSMEAAFKKIQRTTLKSQGPGALLDEVYSIAAGELINLREDKP